MKLWMKQDEWTHYAACGGSEDHTNPPEREYDDNILDDESGLPRANPRVVRSICAGCRVRPECIAWATDPKKPESGVWCAGKYIPTKKQAARRVRNELRASLPSELAARGDDI